MTVTSFTPKKIEDTSSGRHVDMRGIQSKTMQDFNVLTYQDRQEYIYPSGGIKVRTLPEKGFYAKNGFKGDELFGMNMFTAGCSKKVTITEGELDALSAAQMLKSSYLNPVVSLPSANPSKKLWDNCHDWLNSFDQIILSVDTDEAGNAVADKIAKMFPNKVYRVDHSRFKDANEFLQKNAGAEFKSAWWNAKKYTPENVLNTTEQFLSLYRDTPEHQYVPTGIQALDDKIMGLMQGHFTVIKAPTGIGKTEVMRYLEYNMLQRKVPIASWHLEETKLRSLLGLVSYELQDNLTRRDLIDEKQAEDQVVEAIKKLRSAIQSLNKEGRERLLDAFVKVNVEFQRLFSHLFGGGTAELQLVENEDPLEAGLEILARPPGKKPQTMTLLSGGEQALTALALIFAVFLTNPAPICVLDEVDAPLDDHNVERYCNLMEEMAKSTDTRFVIITHNPITMARMNRLFGVTMAEQGVSTLVSVDLQTAEQLREAV